MLGTVVLGMVLWAAAPAGAGEIADPGDSVLTASPVVPNEKYTGELSTADDADWYRVNVERPLTAVQVAVRQLNNVCDVWVRLVSLDGLVLDQVNAARHETRAITVVVPSGGPYFIVIDHGPTAMCGGATYSVVVALADAAPSLKALTSPSARKRLARPNYYLCQIWSGVANKHAVIIRRTKRAIRRANGAGKRRLQRKLGRSQKQYRKARKKQRDWC